MLRYLLGAAVGVFAVVVSASPSVSEASAASTERLYLYDYYFDAAKTQYAGTSVDECIGNTVVPGPVYGTQTAYFTREWIGNCPGFLF